jgi:hypothetical protein
LSLGAYGATKSAEIGIVSFLVGVFIDLDHFFDYWRQHPWKVDVLHFFEVCHNCELKGLYLFLHSIELFVALAAIAFFTKSELAVAVTFGMGQHIGFDIMTNELKPLGYFFVYRLVSGFKSSEIFVEGAYGNDKPYDQG